MSDQSIEQASPTARETSGILGLGRSGGQRSAEMLAGIRAELMPKPEYVAMSRPVGRVVGGMIVRLGRSEQAKLNFLVARPEAFYHLISEALRDKPNPQYVELASGFLPRAWQMASQFPAMRVTEIDLPEVIEEKRRRFSKAKLALPPNLRMLSADLGVTPLSAVLGGEKADVISAEGLLMYLPLDRVQQVATGVRDSLKTGGVFVADLLTKEAAQEVMQSKARQAANLFRRNAGEWLGMVDNAAHAQALFSAAGYSSIEFHQVSAIAEALPELRKPISDVTLIVVARN